MIYLLLSPTFGMHQYTADLANRAGELGSSENEPPIHLITTSAYPADRYGPQVRVHTPIAATGTGFNREGLDPLAFRRVLATVDAILEEWGRGNVECRMWNVECAHIPHSTFSIPHSPIVHITGVHLWNPLLLSALRRRGVRTVHTLHDLDPHQGVRFGSLIRLWNRLVIRRADLLLVHGERYRQRLMDWGVRPERIVYAPLLHGFLSAAHPWPPRGEEDQPRISQITRIRTQERDWVWDESGAEERRSRVITHPIQNSPAILFFGRLESYKGIHTLLDAWQILNTTEKNPSNLPNPWQEEQKNNSSNSCNSWQNNAHLILAGPLAADVTLPALPSSVELRDRRILDDEGVELFQDADLVVLPYVDATQSALIAAAYAFAKPVIVTRTGALAEYVVEGETGWIVPPNDPAALAQALADALSDPERLQRMGHAARRWFAQQRQHETVTLRAMYKNLATNYTN